MTLIGIKLEGVACRFRKYGYSQLDGRFLDVARIQCSRSESVCLFQTHRGFHTVQFSDVPEISRAAMRQVTLHTWAFENFTALEIVVHILERMHRVKYEEYWLPCAAVI